MGVQGLWQLLQPTGRPISLQSLEGKVLAVDVSIWLHQAVKGMRDKDGSPLPNAHLHVLFTRVCKLLYYKIKPVFVFDGKVPELKKQTMASRRERKMMAEVEGDKTSKKLLDNLLKSHALKEVMNKGHASTASSSSSSMPSTSSQSQESTEKRDLFQLPPLPEEFIRAQEIQPWEVPTTNATIFEDEYQNLDDIDIDSAEFKSLPAEVQHEILSELKERRKRLTRYTNLELPENSDDFSSFQMAKILKQSHLSNKIDKVRKEMTDQVSGEITQDLGEHTIGTEIQAQRILSDDSSHFILIKGLSNKRKMEELNRIKEEAENEEDQKEDIQIVAGVKASGEDKVMDVNLVESDSEKSDEVIQTKHGENETVRNESESPIVVDEAIYDDSDTLALKTTQPIKHLCDSYHGSDDVIQEGSSSCKISQEDNTNSENKELSKSDQSFAREVNLVDEASNKSELSKSKGNEENGLRNPLAVNGRSSQQSESSDSEDEGFIEVSFDPKKLGPDELFPADIFTTSSSQHKSLTPTPSPEKQLLIEPEPPTGPEHLVDSDHTESSEPEHIEITEPEPTKTTSEAPRDLVKQFTQLVENDIHRVSEDLVLETRALQQERGRQERLATSLSDQMYLEAQDLLKLFGVPYVLSPTEAEAQCAWLDSIDLTNGTITEDSDIWLFGGKRVYKNFFNQDRTVELYLKDSIQSQLGLNRDILINMALLCGSDYTEGIPGVGPVTAMEILSEFPAVDSSSLQAFK